MTDYFLNRASVRTFTDKEVEPELLDSILTRAAKAPTTGNMQLYSVIVSRNPEMRSRLAETHFNQPASKAPVILTICADFNRFTRWCELRKADAGFDNFLSFTSAMADAIIFAQQVVTVAEQEGLGTCYLGTVTYNAREISEILELPELVVPVACLAIGWPAAEGAPSERLLNSGFVHQEKYRKDSDEEILDIFKIKEDYPANAAFAAENNKENLAQVFAEVRYPRGMNEDFSVRFLELLKQKRFI
ncbi:MAG: nitroreductase family protein [Muribaculaceae bacterium]|nr:nitroreductase family protein [Muribaculaceae bacterium]